MSEWKEYKLSDFMDFNPATPLKKGIEAIKIGMEHLTPNGKKVKEWQYAQFNGGTKFINGDTLVARITPCLENGKIGYVDILQEGEVAFGSTEFMVLREKSGISDSQFVFYFAYWSEFRDLAIQLMTGTSGRQRVETDVLKQKIFAFPSLETQRSIAEVLSSLDDKIDLLTRQNATLEALAQTYFRQWFVEEASEDWGEKRLGEYVYCTTGVSYKGDYMQASDIALVTLKNFDRTGGFSASGYKEYTGSYKECHVVRHGDIIVAHTDLTQDAEVIGNAILVESNPKYKELVLTMDCSKVEIKDTLSKEFVYWLLRSNNFKDYCIGRANGSTVLHLDRKAVVEYIFALPTMDRISKFTIFIKDVNSKKDNNTKQIQTLQRLRDTLLPKLISGEVKVKQ